MLAYPIVLKELRQAQTQAKTQIDRNVLYSIFVYHKAQCGVNVCARVWVCAWVRVCVCWWVGTITPPILLK